MSPPLRDDTTTGPYLMDLLATFNANQKALGKDDFRKVKLVFFKLISICLIRFQMVLMVLKIVYPLYGKKALKQENLI
jgi:hypothetical protein